MIRQERLNDFEESLRIALEETLQNSMTAMPAQVVDVNKDQQTISAKLTLMVNVYDKEGVATLTSYPVLIHVPQVLYRGGGFAITLPLQPEDEILIIFASRCIDAWWENGGTNNQQIEFRINDLSDGFAIPGPCSVPNALTNVSSDTMQIRDVAGTTYVELTRDGKISCVAENEINLTAPTININGQLIQTGAVEISGGLDVDGIPFGTHKHPEVQSGPDITGEPIA